MRMPRAGWGASICLQRCRRLSSLPCSSFLDGTEDGGYFALQRGEVKVDDAAARVKDDINRRAERWNVFADGFAHSAFDAVTVNRLAHNLANREPHARTACVGVAKRSTVRT